MTLNKKHGFLLYVEALRVTLVKIAFACALTQRDHGVDVFVGQ